MALLINLKAVVKYRKYSGITAINQALPNKHFNFSLIEKKDIFDQIMKLKHKKATQDSDIPGVESGLRIHN